MTTKNWGGCCAGRSKYVVAAALAASMAWGCGPGEVSEPPDGRAGEDPGGGGLAPGAEGDRVAGGAGVIGGASDSDTLDEGDGASSGDHGGGVPGAPQPDDELPGDSPTGDPLPGGGVQTGGGELANQNSPVGTNLATLTYWGTQWPLTDLFKQSGEWISGSGGTWDDGRALDLDDDGWVRSLQQGQIARTAIHSPGNVPLPWDRVVVLYDGQGELGYLGVTSTLESAPGREVVELGADTTFAVYIEATDPADYIRNIRVLPEGGVCEDDAFRRCGEGNACDGGAACLSFEDTYEARPFQPDFMARLRRYSTLRFMDWMRTNHSEQSAWSGRPRVADARYSTDAGVPLEVMIALANRMQADPWFTIPHKATDEYVRNFATVVREKLDPELTAYVEHSNELWNGAFRQYHDAEDMGTQAGLGGGNAFQAVIFHHARRSKQIFQIWEEVFGGTERLVRVLGSHAANPWTSQTMLEFEDTAAYTDALAIAPYFGGAFGYSDRASEMQSMSMAGLFASIRNEEWPKVRDWLSRTADITREHGVALVSYEAGQHLTGVGNLQNEQWLNDMFDRANADPRMGEIYTEYMELWKEYGTLMVHFNDCSGWGKYGRWGAMQYITQPRSEAPKYDAIMRFAESTPLWW